MTAALTAPAGAANLVTTPGFEDTDVSARLPFAGAATLIRTTAETNGGAASLFVSARIQTCGGPSQNSMVPGTLYIVSAWVKMVSDTDARPSLNIKSVIGGSTTYATIFSQPTDHTRWVKLAGVYEYDPPSTPSEVTVYVHGPASELDFYVDDSWWRPFPST